MNALQENMINVNTKLVTKITFRAVLYRTLTEGRWHVCLQAKAVLRCGQRMNTLQMHWDYQIWNYAILVHFLGCKYMHYFKFWNRSESLLLLDQQF